MALAAVAALVAVAVWRRADGAVAAEAGAEAVLEAVEEAAEEAGAEAAVAVVA